MIMDRCGTQTSVFLHKFAKVLWWKLRRDNSVMDTDLKIAAANTKPMSMEEIGSDEERQTRLRRKKETLGMDDTLEVPPTRGLQGSDGRGSRDPITQPVETSIAQRSALDLVLWSDEPGGLLEPDQEERKTRGKSVPVGPNREEKVTHELTHTSFRNWCSHCVRARAADDPQHRQPHKEPEFPIIMADHCFMQDAPGSELFTILDMFAVALGMMAAISVEEKGPATYVVLAVVEHLRAWGRKKVIFRIDGEPATRALGVAIQHARSEATVIECRPKYSSPSMGVESEDIEPAVSSRAHATAAPISHVAGLLVCSHFIPVDEILVSYVATHEIDDRPVYDHKTGERLSPHLVKVGRQTEHDAMIRHQLFERVPIAMARGKKVGCRWLDETKEGATGPFVRSRLVAMEVAHGVRFDAFAGTAPLKCIKIIISRAASIKNTRGGHPRLLALYDISVAFWHALLPEDEPIAMYPPCGEEEAAYMWQMKRAMYGTRRASRLFQEHMKGVLTEAGHAALKVCHQVYHCLETDLMAAIHGDDIIAEGEPEKLDRLDEVLKRAAEHG